MLFDNLYNGVKCVKLSQILKYGRVDIYKLFDNLYNGVNCVKLSQISLRILRNCKVELSSGKNVINFGRIFSQIFDLTT